MAKERKLTEEEKREILLKEYELCQASVQSLESAIWQTSAAIGIGSIGSLILVVANVERDKWGLAVIVGGLVTATSFMWWYMARRWWSIQHAKYLRMRHIEEALCNTMYQVRYIQYLDDPKTLSASGLPLEHQHQLRHFSNYQRLGIQCVLRFFPYLVLTAWVLYIGALLLSKS